MDARTLHTKTVPVLHGKTPPKTVCINHHPLRSIHSLCRETENGPLPRALDDGTCEDMILLQEKERSILQLLFCQEEECACRHMYIAGKHLFDSFADQEALINSQASGTQN